MKLFYTFTFTLVRINFSVINVVCYSLIGWVVIITEPQITTKNHTHKTYSHLEAVPAIPSCDKEVIVGCRLPENPVVNFNRTRLYEHKLMKAELLDHTNSALAIFPTKQLSGKNAVNSNLCMHTRPVVLKLFLPTHHLKIAGVGGY